MWTEHNNALQLTLTLPTFMQAVVLLNSIALLAEAANHHPEMTLTYTRLTLRLTTHDAGSTVTQKDRELAEAITAILPPNAILS